MLASDDFAEKDQNLKNEEKLLKMRTPSKVDYNQPFKLMWMMIICNLLCQLIDLSESLAFKLQWNKSNKNTCPISQVVFIDKKESNNKCHCKLSIRDIYNVFGIHGYNVCLSLKKKSKR